MSHPSDLKLERHLLAVAKVAALVKGRHLTLLLVARE